MNMRRCVLSCLLLAKAWFALPAWPQQPAATYYKHRIRDGAIPGDLPVERPTVYTLSLNRKTAAALAGD